MKLLIVAIAISLISPLSLAHRTYGGDMPFPIGKIIEFPKDDGKGVWKDELKKKIFRLRPLKGVLDEGTILVQMLGLNKRVIATGEGFVGEDQILTARLRYVNHADKFVDVKIVNLCGDAMFDNNTDFSITCKEPQMWASMQVLENSQKLMNSEQFMIKKAREER